MALQAGAKLTVILVCVPARRQVLVRRDQPAVVAAVCDATLRHGLRPPLVPPAAAPDLPVVLTVPVVADPPVV